MSPLVLLGSLGTVVSTLSMLPHLAHAVRNRKPSGSAFAWTVGAVSSGIWFVYGIAVGDLLVAAPGFVTIPAGVTLAAWCTVEGRRDKPVTGRAMPGGSPSAAVCMAPEGSGDPLGGRLGVSVAARPEVLDLPRVAA